MEGEERRPSHRSVSGKVKGFTYKGHCIKKLQDTQLYTDFKFNIFVYKSYILMNSSVTINDLKCYRSVCTKVKNSKVRVFKRSHMNVFIVIIINSFILNGC